MNGAIMQRLPKFVYDRWAEDPAISLAIPFSALEANAAQIEDDLQVNSPLAPGLDSLPVHRILQERGWAHQAMDRNAPECKATGRCLQGCPSGAKLSLENSYVPRFISNGGRLVVKHRVERIIIRKGSAEEVVALSPEHELVRFAARKAIIVAAGAVHSPFLLWKSGIENPEIGKHFQCHLSAASVALLPRPVREMEGPPQGIEVTYFESEGLSLPLNCFPRKCCWHAHSCWEIGSLSF